jgi:FkbM family methyltransferase
MVANVYFPENRRARSNSQGFDRALLFGANMHGIFFNPPIDDNFVGHIMAEVYKDRVYDEFLKGRKDLTILDIGANIGITSYYFSQFAKKVYSVEPSLEHFDILSRMIKFNRLDNVAPICKAIYIKNDKLPLFHNKNKTMFSLHMAVRDPSLKEELVDCITIDKLLERNKIDKVDFMKMDIEGSEVEVVCSPGFRKSAPKIDTIVMEVHDWSGRHPNQIKDALRSYGYNLDTLKTDANVIVARRDNV